MQRFARVVVLAALVTATASCGDVVRQGRAPVFLVIDSLQAASGKAPDELFSFLLSDVESDNTSPPCSTAAPCPTYFNDPGRVTLRTVPKDLGSPALPTVPTSNNEVTITRYRVSYRRADRPNGGTPGVDVPFAFDGAATGTVPNGGSQLSIGFQLVRHVAKRETPLIQLIVSPTVITTIADVTFYGQDRVGNAISVTGSIQIDFGNFGG